MSFKNNSVSEGLQISGIPASFEKSIKVKIKYSGELSENSYIAVGEKYLDEESGSKNTAFSLNDAIDSSGFLIGEISTTTNSNLSKSDNSNNTVIDRLITAVKGYKEKESNNFKIHYPALIDIYFNEFSQVLEEILGIIKNDLGVSIYPRTFKQNIVINYNNEIVSYNFPSYQNIILIISLDHIINQKYDDIKPALGHKLLKMELIYTTGLADWFRYAVLSWSEEIFTINQNFKQPNNFSKSGMQPFYGIQKYQENEQIHGVGISAIIKFLTQNEEIYGKSGIGKTYNDIDNNLSTITALTANVNDVITNWFPNFYKEYISGNIYNQPINYFLDSTQIEWNVNSITDTLKIFNEHISDILYADLSAKLFKINLDHSNFTEKHNLQIMFDGPEDKIDGLSLLLFAVRDNEPIYLGDAHSEGFEIPDLKAYYDSGITQFLIALVNSNYSTPDYLGVTHPVELTAEIINEDNKTSPGLDYNLCHLDVYVNADFIDTRYAEEYQNYSSPISLGTANEYDTEIWSIEGSFEGNTFTGTFDNATGQTSTATVILNDAHDMVIDYSWAEVDTSLAISSNKIRSVSGVSGKNIPINTAEDGLFELSGNNACSGVSTLLDFSKREFEKFGTVRVDSSQVIGYSCDNNSRVIIQFYKE